MRHRIGVFLLAIVLSLASVPAHAAPVRSDSFAVASRVERAPVTAAALVAPVTAVESVHVYLLAQLTVPDAVGRDSVALRNAVARGMGAVIVSLDAERLPVYRAAVILRDSNDDPTRESLHRPIEPPNPARASRVSRTPHDSTALRVGVVLRR